LVQFIGVCFEKLQEGFTKIKFADFIFILLFLCSIVWQLENIKFIYDSVRIVLGISTPLIIIFAWFFFREIFDRNTILTVGGILLAVLIFFLQTAYEDAKKIESVSSANNQNCLVANSILILKGKPDLATNFPLQYFVIEPYFNNSTFIFNRFGTTTGTLIVNTAYKMQSANALLAIIQNIIVQGVNPYIKPYIDDYLRMYNSQLLDIASTIKENICK